MNELAKELRSEMRCRPLNTNKYMSFSIRIKEEVKTEHKEQKEPKKKVITYNLKFIDSKKHIDRSLSELVDNLYEFNSCNCDEPKNKNMQNK